MSTSPESKAAAEPKKLFVVDDDTALGELLQQKLRQHGYAVYTHHTCRNAAEAAAIARPDIVVVDIMLGDGVGYEVARRLRSHPQMCMTPILFMSSLDHKREVAYAFEQGGDAYLTKPFTLENLLARLDQMQRLIESLNKRHSATGLPGTEFMCRQVDYRLLREEEFALCYATVDYYDAFRARRGAAACEDLEKFLADLIHDTLRRQKYAEHCLCHSGGAHFLFFAPPEEYKKTCHHLTHRFETDSRRFYRPEELEQNYQVASKHQGVYAGYPLMKLRICVAHSNHKTFRSAQDVLSQLRSMQEHSQSMDEERVFTFKQGLKW
jgi:CheY-like chemotaxis protein